MGIETHVERADCQRRGESGGVVGEELSMRGRSRRRITEKGHRRCACWPGLWDLGWSPQVSQDPLNDGGVVNQRDQPKPASTAGTGQHVEAHAAAHQVRPAVVAAAA